jgi:hypothetical protein
MKACNIVSTNPASQNVGKNILAISETFPIYQYKNGGRNLHCINSQNKSCFQ